MNKRFTQKLLPGSTLALSLLLLAACMPDEDFSNIQLRTPSPSLSLPILNTNLRVEDMIRTTDGGMLEQNSDQSYSLFYRQSVSSPDLEELLPPLPPQRYSQEFSLGIDMPTLNISPPPVEAEGKMPLNLGGLSIFGIECKAGLLEVNTSSDYQHDVDITLTFPDITDATGRELSMRFNLTNWGSSNSQQQVNLEQHFIRLQDDSIRYRMTASITASGAPISENESINFDFRMRDLAFSYLEGNFSDITVPLEADTLQIPFLANAVNGNVALNPSFRFNFTNSFGVQLQPDLSNVFVTRKSGTVVRMQDDVGSDFFSGEFSFPYPQHRDEGSVSAEQLINRDNSNIEEAFAELPRGIAHGIGFRLNSHENDTSFITDQSRIGLDMEVEIPLEGSFDITLEDTIAVNLNFEQEVESLRMLIKTENSFPIDARMQIYFLDESGDMIMDTDGEPLQLFDQEAQLLRAAQITNSTTGETQINAMDMPVSATIDTEKYEAIRNAGNILVRASLSSNQDMIRLYGFYNIRFSMAMQLRASL